MYLRFEIRPFSPSLYGGLTESVLHTSRADWDGIDPIHACKATPEFKERIGRVKQHTDELTAAEAELVVRVEAAASVA